LSRSYEVGAHTDDLIASAGYQERFSDDSAAEFSDNLLLPARAARD